MNPKDTRPFGSTSLLDPAAYPSMRAHTPALAFIGKLTLISRRKWMIAKATGVGLLIGVATSFLLPVRYTATTRIMTPRQSESTASMLMSQLAVPGAGALAAGATGGVFGLKNPNDIYIGLLNSRPIADGVIQQFNLMSIYGARDMSAARRKLTSNTSILSEKSGLLSISVTDKDKQRSAEIANAYTAGLRELSKHLAISEASQRRLFYEEQLAHEKNDLFAAENAFQQVQVKKGLVQPEAQAKALVGGLADLQAQIAGKEVQLEAELTYSTDQNPQVQLTKQQLASLRAQAAKMQQPANSPGSLSLGLSNVPDAQLAYLNAEHEVRYRQVLFDLLLKQYDAAKLDESKSAAVIQVVETAIPPDRKSFPSRAPIIVAIMLLFFLGACASPLISDFIQSNREIEQSLSELKATLIRR
jgi:tyrosine-protein kinase Etk/Wzc